MKIRPNKDVYVWIAMAVISICICDVVMLIKFEGTGLPVIIGMTVLLFALLLRYAEAIGKVIILDSKGCTISFLFYRKTYSWNEFSIKRWENFRNAYSHKEEPEVGVMFSVKLFRRPQWIPPNQFCMLTAPLSSFFVCFSDGPARCPNPYAVDEASFLETLSRWGVELDES